jgi:hypothetical protein
MARVIRFVTCQVPEANRQEYLSIMIDMKAVASQDPAMSGFYLLEDRATRGLFRECYEYPDEESLAAVEKDSSRSDRFGPLVERLRQIVPAESVTSETYLQMT